MAIKEDKKIFNAITKTTRAKTISLILSLSYIILLVIDCLRVSFIA